MSKKNSFLEFIHKIFRLVQSDELSTHVMRLDVNGCLSEKSISGKDDYYAFLVTANYLANKSNPNHLHSTEDKCERIIIHLFNLGYKPSEYAMRMAVSRHASMRVLTALKAAGGDINGLNSENIPPIFSAINLVIKDEKLALLMIDQLIELGADIDYVDPATGKNALMFAGFSGSKSAVDSVLRHSKDPIKLLQAHYQKNPKRPPMTAEFITSHGAGGTSLAMYLSLQEINLKQTTTPPSTPRM